MILVEHLPSWDLRAGSMALRALRTLERRARFCLNKASRWSCSSLWFIVLKVTVARGAYEVARVRKSGFVAGAVVEAVVPIYTSNLFDLYGLA